MRVGKECVINGELVAASGNITIGDYVAINQGTRFFSADRIEIEDNVMTSWGCSIVDSNMHTLRRNRSLSKKELGLASTPAF